jgi:putative ABC transport system permease protein
MGADLKYAWRALSRHWIATSTAVVCLAVGIGANTALFGVLDALLFRPPSGVAAPGELTRLKVGAAESGGGGWAAGSSATYPAYEDARNRLAEVATVAAYAPRTLTLGAGERAQPLESVIASGNYFTVLGVQPHRGRFFGDEEAVHGALPTAVLSHAAWRRHFDGDPGAVGRSIELNGTQVTVIGVAPPGFVGVDLGQPDVWLPLGAVGLEALGGDRQFTDRVYWLQMLARRHAGVPQARLDDVAAGAAWDIYSGPAPVALRTEPLRAMFFAEQRGANPVPPWAIGITAAVLLLACATVANLLLAQGALREREIAIRLALGAPRSRIARQLLLENLLIAVAAAAGATVLAMWSNGLLRALPIPVIPRLVDLRVTGFAFLVAIGATLLFGVAPALRAARGDLDGVLRRGSRGSGGPSKLQHGLMVTQIALSFTLLIGAGLFIASFRNAQQIDVGFDMDRVLTAAVPLGAASPADRQLFVERSLERVRRLPGVEAASAGGIIPFYFYSRGSFQITDGRSDDEQPQSLLVNPVADEYFRALGISAAAGRLLDDRDRAGAPPVAVVSAALARRYWPDGTAVGSCILLRVPHGDSCVRVVGIAGDVRFSELRGAPDEVLYLAAAQDPRDVGPATLFIRTQDAPAEMAAAVRQSIQSLDAGSPYVHVQALDAWARPQRLEWEVAARLFSAFGALATLLAAVGLYMVVAFIVTQRTREIGIRMAIGAPRGAVLRLVLGRGVRLTFAGIAVGTFCSLILGRLLASRLYGVSPADAGTFAAVTALLTLVALAASGAPASAAARVEPMRVLREE